MNPSQEQPSNQVFTDGELSEEDLKQIAGGLLKISADLSV
ncbi:hypothetical protein SAMD00079811_24580 [Scytonema sp. HK-05]|nr:hypothetical protein SAMD00079811_24580 [Scytonema sp. HK-05]